MLPLGLPLRPARLPWATLGLLVVTLAVFVQVRLLRDAPVALFCSDLTESAAAVARAEGTVQAFVCRWGAVPEDVREGTVRLPLVTATFVHVGWLHVVSNAAFLGAFGPRVEEALGRVRFLALYVAGGALAGLARVATDPNGTDPAVGASGAVAVVLGIHLLLARGTDLLVLVGPVPLRLPTRFVISLWAVQQVVLGAVVLRRAGPVAGGTAYDVHVAGLALGLVVGALVTLPAPGGERLLVRLLGVTVGGVATAGVIAAVALADPGAGGVPGG